ncbi:hypothetical protein RHGRI_009893 [Rhododendron griersonianum]|uniref:F-box associated beta-propeller type 1 domain-containing protein n=1 Tax=Rhododendron griersonianum TaxID=479676 RepID=A0AAV6KGF4_9ERIC|nr:hypothetical protein RHGRI_009893 [Rhododendron griersonianum]
MNPPASDTPPPPSTDSVSQSTEETNHLERSTKKIKRDHPESSIPVEICPMESEIEGNPSEVAKASQMEDSPMEHQREIRAAIKEIPKPTEKARSFENSDIVFDSVWRVCKTWRKLTLERYFAELHHSRFPLSLISYYKATDQYKVLRYTITNGQTRLLEIDIYTLGIDDEWRSLGETAPAPAILTSELVFLNGALHWIGFQDSWLICYFDIEKEQFGSFPLPSHIGDAGKYLGVVDNQLYIRNEQFGVRKFWMMKHYGNFGSWTLECGFLEPLIFLKDGSLLMSDIEAISRNGSLASYNPQTSSLQWINCDGLRLLRGATYAYVPSFFSPMDALA